MIVGGGVTGLSIAYNLAKIGASVTIIERGYIGSGSSTRNAANARAHFFNKEATIIAWESLKLMYKLSKELNYNTLFIKRGYLWLLYTEEQYKRFKQFREFWSKLGIPDGKMLSVEDLKERYPFLNLKGVIGGFLGHVNGRYHHDAIVRGYWRACKNLGVKIYEYTEAKKLIREGSKVVGVETNVGKVYARKCVVLAAGPWTRLLAKSVGIDLPIEPVRKELLVTEPVKIKIKPLVISMKTNAYVQQTLRGEVLGSVETPMDIPIWEFKSTYQFPLRTVRAIIELVPALAVVNFMRQWAGHYDVTPDNNPILGFIDEIENLAVAAGFSGHGFMLAPAVGKYMALLLDKGHLDPIIKPFNYRRFKEGKLITEQLVIG